MTPLFGMVEGGRGKSVSEDCRKEKESSDLIDLTPS
jgi:hypothetical protein